jgi:hypothetical protein
VALQVVSVRSVPVVGASGMLMRFTAIFQPPLLDRHMSGSTG